MKREVERPESKNLGSGRNRYKSFGENRNIEIQERNEEMKKQGAKGEKKNIKRNQKVGRKEKKNET